MRVIRPEEARDAAAVYDVNARAFARPDEARLVDRLRREAAPYIGLVAEDVAGVVGHIAFTPVTIVGWNAHPPALGLAPLAVAPAVQRQGVGSQLARAGLEICRQRGFALVVVLGDPGYYGRFGFEPASDHGLRDEYHAPPGAFRVLALVEGSLAGARGTVRYHAAFAQV